MKRKIVRSALIFMLVFNSIELRARINTGSVIMLKGYGAGFITASLTMTSNTAISGIIGSNRDFTAAGLKV